MDYDTILKTIGEKPEHMYTTERGSTYAHYKDNSSVRNRSGTKHLDKSTGLQARSGKTVYLSPADVTRMAGVFQNVHFATDFKPISYDKETGTGRVALVHAEDFGPKKAGSVVHEAVFTTKPKIGLNPVEIYKSQSPRGDSGKGIHWGSKITEVRGGGGSGGVGMGVSDRREMQLGAELDPKDLMQRNKYKAGGTVLMPNTYSDGNWSLI
jgi:hypothetical protein